MIHPCAMSNVADATF